MGASWGPFLCLLCARTCTRVLSLPRDERPLTRAVIRTVGPHTARGAQARRNVWRDPRHPLLLANGPAVVDGASHQSLQRTRLTGASRIDIGLRACYRHPCRPTLTSQAGAVPPTVAGLHHVWEVLTVALTEPLWCSGCGAHHTGPCRAVLPAGGVMETGGWRCSCGVLLLTGQVHVCGGSPFQPILPPPPLPVPLTPPGITSILEGVECSECHRPLAVLYEHGPRGALLLKVLPHTCPGG